MQFLELDSYPLARLADQVGTPFFLYDGHELDRRLANLNALTEGDALQARYAMKANSCWKVLDSVRAAGLWIDAVSGNEVLRARRAGFAMGARAAGRHADRGRVARQRADHGARARRDAQRRLPGHDRRAARRRIRRSDRGAREPGVRARARAVVRHGRPVVEARHLARGADRAARRARRRPSCRSSRCTRTSAPGPDVREFEDNLRARRRAGRRRGSPPSRTSRPSTWAAASPTLTARARRSTTSAAFAQLLVEAAARLAAAAGRPDPRRDRARPLSRRRRGIAGVSREGHQADADQRRRGRATSSSWSTPASTT